MKLKRPSGGWCMCEDSIKKDFNDTRIIIIIIIIITS
jgi:hypothetical protein